ncbi:AQG_2a_G0030680.mRNA.1.CDS.1 [Saccharomyces cerevisiae]|jgi:inosine triphosphate pyrophosphatase|uniref:Inosine triphosphate pyrophosphatase n=10 Tax=Saccharomyces TaxID=4930 RepID=ITPA_YEAST|nr:nucleoside triphosphate pyrophosphohydrolase HAM1 [Saccharomyces cerevisiae S288C]P47119.1 RecName: Full=Inosine triphosphate pyrophosphatase; Short=ITPase; Short=Inosine triphosphatase; AltName: Full=Hydroxylaminopurine sensitivity protein 1; AltName: Full=Non-canonical purine NTP pyrophosphatase; AltName: Full=Non-standard purine NTP pyrophosphatase; AltName: Full=Nucleoside-triphosphate diphosphatase; AltName: Full=Nucleoside-triphosphate pyrophosphatase; Short=NTPase [Saccharomyces cerevisi|eukprot:NP_012603.1 nucleoside triphosphate pyrophosphohydrolase HAM1 [Saccharomyces cerevisiae S288C]
MSNNEIVFVTGNANKLKEVQSILTQEVDNNNKTIHLINEALDLEELQDTDLNAIALAKGKQAVAALGKGKPVFVEDTALRFDEFNGLPGAYIKWFLKSMGLEKIVKMLEPFENKNAEAVTTICFADSRGEYHFFQGITRGKIVPSRGPTTFGWDSIFEPFDSHGLTYAEMSKDAKNAISHRGKAFAQFKEYLYQNDF